MLATLAWAWIAIVVAVVWKMAFGSVVYARPVLGTWWAKQVGLDMENVPRGEAMKGLLYAVVWSIVGVLLFDALWSWTGAHGASEGLMVGLVAGLGLAATAAMVHPPFEQRPAGIMWMYGGYHLVEWLGVGLIFGLLA